MPTYISPMYYRDWTVDVSRRYTTLNSGASVSYTIPFYTASIPVGASASEIEVYLYVALPDGGRLRITRGSVSVDTDRAGVVRLLLTGSDIPSGMSAAFGRSGYYMVSFTFTNIGSRTLRFCVPMYMPFIKYTSGSPPAPYYHGTVPRGTPGNYVDYYDMPGYSLWATRFNYRGIRTAFPFLTIGNGVAGCLASLEVDMMRNPVSVRPSGTTLRALYREFLRWVRLTGKDGVYMDTWVVIT